MITVRLHRWQPKANRYRSQNFNISESKPIMDMLFNKGAATAALRDVATNQVIARTQQVDRIVFDSFNETLEVFLSPTVIRKYERTAPVKTDVRKARPTDERCQCHHLKDDHAFHRNHEPNGICLIPGCNCDHYFPLQRTEIKHITQTFPMESERFLE